MGNPIQKLPPGFEDFRCVEEALLNLPKEPAKPSRDQLLQAVQCLNKISANQGKKIKWRFGRDAAWGINFDYIEKKDGGVYLQRENTIDTYFFVTRAIQDSLRVFINGLYQEWAEGWRPEKVFCFEHSTSLKEVSCEVLDVWWCSVSSESSARCFSTYLSDREKIEMKKLVEDANKAIEECPCN